MSDDIAIYRRTLDGFIPANEMAQEFFSKAKLGELVTLHGKKPRSLQYHRLFFAILNLISDNSNPHITPGEALFFAKVAANTGRWIKDSKGGEWFAPGSISFAKMDAAAFEAFVQTAIPPLVGRFMRGTAPETLINEAMALAA
jgi:hypothetical protein